MQTNRCPTCGLVNSRAVIECRRCHGPLAGLTPPPAFEHPPQFPSHPAGGLAPPAPGQAGAQWAAGPGPGAPGGFAGSPQSSTSWSTTSIVLVGCAGFAVFAVVVVVLLIAVGRSSSGRSSETAKPAERAPKAAAPTSASGTPQIEREFEIPMPGGNTAAAATTPQPNGRRVVAFNPGIPADDVLVGIAATLTCRELFGSHRGILTPADATSTYDSVAGAVYLSWPIEDPSERFCFLPVKDSDSGRVIAAWVWTE